MTTNPQIRQLAAEAAQKIKRLTDAHNSQIERIYQDFRTKANAIHRKSQHQRFDRPGADFCSLPDDHTEHQEI